MFLKRLPLGPISANCYVISDEESGVGAVIDPGDFTRELLNTVAEAKIRELSAILCTHGHFDHCGGIYALKEKFPEARVYIGEADSVMLSDSEKSLAASMGANQQNVCPDVLLKNGETVTVGGLSFSVLATPGHTPGGVCYISDSERCVFTGDTLFCRTVGRTDFEGGSLSELLDSLEKLMHLPDDYIVYTGHNIPTQIGAERTTNRYLRKRDWMGQ